LNTDFVCPACGQANKETASFCRECGIRLAAVPPLAKPQIVAFAPVSNAPQSRSGHGRARRGVVIGAAAAAVLGAAVLAGWLTNWPQQLFGSPASDVSGPESAVSVRTRPAAQESSVPASPSTASTRPAVSASPPASGGSPAAIVQAYFAAINAHDYVRAWQLGGKSTGSSYPAFVDGFEGTAEDTVTIISVSSDEVTAQVAASQTDGTVKDYSGVYTTADGAIVQSQVQQTS
jgi:eukaryotic-like serine/threonine-protein kinase